MQPTLASMRELGLAARRNALLARITLSETAAATPEVRHRRTNAIEAYDPDGASHDFKCVAAIYRRRRELAKAPAAHADVLTE